MKKIVGLALLFSVASTVYADGNDGDKNKPVMYVRYPGSRIPCNLDLDSEYNGWLMPKTCLLPSFDKSMNVYVREAGMWWQCMDHYKPQGIDAIETHCGMPSPVAQTVIRTEKMYIDNLSHEYGTN